MPNKKLRFGCHDFLNSQPILHPITAGLVKPPFEITLDSPAKLADMLKAKKLDLAFIPVAEYAEIPGLRIVPGFSISAMGDVKTVLLHSAKKIADVKTIRADARSRTSVSLLKLLLRAFYKSDAVFVGPETKEADAELIIGDEAFSVPQNGRIILDLAGEWLKFTKKPFVFAALCVAEGVDADEAISALEKSKMMGVRMTDDICRTWKMPDGASSADCEDYLLNRIRYDLAPDDIEGLRLFFQLAHSHGVIKSAPRLLFY
ncbi:MAG: menaquinone biosynthesis protein [Nitrospinae bacterium]|nr:menaquinone biosynthesis protein [Nitrospinota bacterium]